MGEGVWASRGGRLDPGPHVDTGRHVLLPTIIRMTFTAWLRNLKAGSVPDSFPSSSFPTVQSVSRRGWLYSLHGLESLPSLCPHLSDLNLGTALLTPELVSPFLPPWFRASPLLLLLLHSVTTGLPRGLLLTPECDGITPNLECFKSSLCSKYDPGAFQSESSGKYVKS